MSSGKWSVFTIIICSLSFAYYLVGGNLKATFWEIDDHEIFNFLGSEQKVPVGKIIEKLSQTEVGNYGTALRFRPGYYFLKISEASLFGARAEYWYGFRLLILSLAIGTTLWLLTPQFGWLLSGSLVLWLFAQPLWIDLLTRLGTSEIYATLGICLILIGARKGIMYPRKNSLWGWLIMVGYLIAAGSKENFLFLLIPVLGYYYWLKRHQQLSPTAKAQACIILAFSLWIMSSVVLGVTRSGHDMYQREIQSGPRLIIVSKYGIKSVLNPYILTFLVVYGSVIYWWRQKNIERFHLLKPFVIKGAIAAIFLFLTYISQIYYYYGLFPETGKITRYSFPGMLVPFMAFVLALWLTKHLSFIAQAPGNFTKFIYITLSFVIIYHALLLGYEPLKSEVTNNVVRTHFSMQYIYSLSQMLKQHPDIDLVYVINYPAGQIEKAVSLARYLRYLNISNDFFLLPDFNSETIDGNSQYLVSLIMELSQGNPINDSLNGDYYEPLSTLDQDNCLYIFNASSKFPCYIAKPIIQE